LPSTGLFWDQQIRHSRPVVGGQRTVHDPRLTSFIWR
jgi:hypothetical protein